MAAKTPRADYQQTKVPLTAKNITMSCPISQPLLNTASKPLEDHIAKQLADELMKSLEEEIYNMVHVPLKYLRES